MTQPTLIEQQDKPMSLKHAAEMFGLGVDTLRAERRRGRLTTYRIGREIKTTAADVREMIALCREEPKAPASIVTRRAVNTSSETVAASYDSAMQAALKLRRISRDTLPANTSPRLTRVL